VEDLEELSSLLQVTIFFPFPHLPLLISSYLFSSAPPPSPP
jgi:hypothetical protein